MKRLCLLLLLFACGGPPAPPPQTQPQTSAPPAEMSTIIVPIQVSLAPLLPLLEAQVPKSAAKLDAYELDPQGRFGLKYQVQRDPIALEMIGAGLHASATVHYALEGCARTKNPVSGNYAMWPCVSCGFGEPTRQARISLQSRFDWRPDWTIGSTTLARPVEFPNRCTVTFFNVDVTDWKLGPLVNEQLQDVAKTIDHNTPAMTKFKPAAQQVWSLLQTPFEIGPRTWLVLEPSDVGLAPIRGSGLNVNTAMAMQARTRIVIGQKPAAAIRPLPPLRTAAPADASIRVPFDIEIDYAEASRLVAEQLGGKTWDVAGAKLSVSSINLSPGENGKMNVEADIDYRGGALKNYRGVINLEGIPLFDGRSSSVSFPDLEYKIDSKRRNPFIRTANRLAHDAVRARLRENARWPVGEQTSAMKSEIDKGLTRELAAGVMLRGRVSSLEPASITAEPNAIRIRVIAVGSAEVVITRLP